MLLSFLKRIIPQSGKNFYHLAQAFFANVFFGFPSKKIKIVGVTGTNGKTTTCQMIAKILEEDGKKVALASTINFKINRREWVNKTKFTTLSAWAVQKFIAQAVKNDCQYLVLETSSHSLDQYRVWGVDYAVAVITNITREHLDYHQTMEQYKNAKLKLFKKVPVRVVNLAMDWAEEFLNCGVGERWGYFVKNENVKCKMENYGRESFGKDLKIIKAEKVELGESFSRFKISGADFQLKLLGGFNVENAAAAVAVGLSQRVSLESASRALSQIEKIPGRLDEVKNDLGIKIFIDYALTPDSMEKLGRLMADLRPSSAQLIWVFGSCGQRDKGKRPIMGEIVAGFADKVIVTNEDPYGEDPQAIIDEVFIGVMKNKKMKEKENCWRIMDRRQAIAQALQLAGKGDVVLITGKGAEETMATGEKERIDWNDRRVVEEEIEKIKCKFQKSK